MKYTAMLFKKIDDGTYLSPNMTATYRLTKSAIDDAIKTMKRSYNVYLDKDENYIVEIECDEHNK